MGLLKLSHRVLIKLYVFFLSVIVWLLCFGVASAEEITSFVSDITINADSSVLITETITYDYGTASKHGIFRNIRETHPQPASTWYKSRYIDYELHSVTRDGHSELYTLQNYNGLSVKIGDPNKTVTGQHVYMISYLARGALAEYPEGIELYWNVTGDEWEVPMRNVAVNVKGEGGVRLLPTFACYAGTEDATDACTDVWSDGEVTSFTQATLRPSEQLTIAQRIQDVSDVYPKEEFDMRVYLVLYLVVSAAIAFFLKKNFIFVLVAILFGFLLLGLLAYLVYQFTVQTVSFFVFLALLYVWKTEYKISRPVIVQYEPYQDFKPMFTGVLFDNRLDSRDITAGIIFLAQQGFISIKEVKRKVMFFTEKDYEITLLRTSLEAEDSFQVSLLKILFENHENAGESTLLSHMRYSSKKQSQNLAVSRFLEKVIGDDLVSLGFVESKMRKLSLSYMYGVLVIIVFVSSVMLPFTSAIFSSYNGVVVNISMIVSLIFLVLAFLCILFLGLERRTTKGHEALWHLKGFKQFLSVTEKDRYKFHNAPALNPKQFMEYLPYAIAFGVEKEWAKVFKDIQIDVPSWYGSDTNSSFNAATFTAGLFSFSNSFSNSTGSSGSVGGGSAGGGGGGGGGGSW